jgi:hypothetical protein
MESVTIIKKTPAGAETWRYPGDVLQQTETGILVIAHFNRADSAFHGIHLTKGDPFIEAYYSDRWYNLFEIYDRDSGALKGWYCNVTFPAEFTDGTVEYRDLALDLLVYPDGRQLLLDEDEFAELDIGPAERARALQAVDELRSLFKENPGLRLKANFAHI